MIYKYLDADAKIKQGDIFLNVPKVVYSSSSFSVIGDRGELENLPWEDAVKEEKGISALVGITFVIGIVASQNCDAERAADIMLCEIKKVGDIFNAIDDKKSPKNIVKEILAQLAKSPRWFYLPPDDNAGFSRRMGVDFLSTISIPREQLLQWRRFRKARLNDVAYEHFRERLSFFFHRYAYSEWYPLSKDEIQYYEHVAKLIATDFFPWQT